METLQADDDEQPVSFRDVAGPAPLPLQVGGSRIARVEHLAVGPRPHRLGPHRTGNVAFHFNSNVVHST